MVKIYPRITKPKKFYSELCGNLEKVTTTIQNIRIALSGLVFYDECSPAQQLITRVPTHGRPAKGSPTYTYINTLVRDSALENVKDLESCKRY